MNCIGKPVFEILPKRDCLIRGVGQIAAIAGGFSSLRGPARQCAWSVWQAGIQRGTMSVLCLKFELPLCVSPLRGEAPLNAICLTPLIRQCFSNFWILLFLMIAKAQDAVICCGKQNKN